MQERFRSRIGVLMADGWRITKDWFIKGKQVVSGYAVWNMADEAFKDITNV